jgi:hypothetical protein
MQGGFIWNLSLMLELVSFGEMLESKIFLVLKDPRNIMLNLIHARLSAIQRQHPYTILHHIYFPPSCLSSFMRIYSPYLESTRSHVQSCFKYKSKILAIHSSKKTGSGHVCPSSTRRNGLVKPTEIEECKNVKNAVKTLLGS